MAQATNPFTTSRFWDLSNGALAHALGHAGRGAHHWRTGRLTCSQGAGSGPPLFYFR